MGGYGEDQPVLRFFYARIRGSCPEPQVEAVFCDQVNQRQAGQS
jgi:hypothetical protein